MKIKRIPMFILLISSATTAYSQNDLKHEDINYTYSILDTPYGDYFGELILFRNTNYKQGILLDQDSLINPVKVLKLKNENLKFKAFIEETNVKFDCVFLGDSIKCIGNVKGDDFNYFLKGIKKGNGVSQN